MSLKMFLDSACTQPVLTAEKFPGTNVQSVFTLSAFTGAQLGSVYKETKTVYSGMTLLGSGSSSVIYGFIGLVPQALVGQRVVVGSFTGQITSNTDITADVDFMYTTLEPITISCVAYRKIYAPIDFTLSGADITLSSPLLSNETLYAVPLDTLAMFFGGSPGSTVTKTATIYVKRESDDFEYTLLQITSDDASLVPYHQTTPNVTFVGGLGINFSGLPATGIGGLVGKAVNHNGRFAGIIASNTETTVQLQDVGFTGPAADAEVYNVSGLEFSINGAAWAATVHPDDMTGQTGSLGYSNKIAVAVRDTVTIPNSAINYPSALVKVSGIEYIA